MTYACVVVGTDGSATAERAVRHGAELAAVDDARMGVVTAYEAEHRPALGHLAGTDPSSSAHRQASAPNDMRWMLTDRGQADGVAQRARTIAHEAGVNGVVI